jgi:hypothetical protein
MTFWSRPRERTQPVHTAIGIIWYAQIQPFPLHGRIVLETIRHGSGMAAEFRVFFSALTSEFGSARDTLAASLRSRDLLLRVQSDVRQQADAATTLRKLHDYIRDCSAVVRIIGRIATTTPRYRPQQPRGAAASHQPARQGGTAAAAASGDCSCLPARHRPRPSALRRGDQQLRGRADRHGQNRGGGHRFADSANAGKWVSIGCEPAPPVLVRRPLVAQRTLRL